MKKEVYEGAEYKYEVSLDEFFSKKMMRLLKKKNIVFVEYELNGVIEEEIDFGHNQNLDVTEITAMRVYLRDKVNKRTEQ